MIRGFKTTKDLRFINGVPTKKGTWICTDTSADNAFIIIEAIKKIVNSIDCKIVLKGLIYDDPTDCWVEWSMNINCLAENNQLQEYFQGALLGEVRNQVNSTIVEYEIQNSARYGVYNGNTPIFTGIESFKKADEAFFYASKACETLGLRCDLVNEITGEVIA